MIDDAVLAALARALELGGGVEDARAALRRADPLIRGAATRRLRAAHAEALLATHVKEGPHGLRLAYLLVARALPPPRVCDDVAAVEAAYAAAARPAHPGRWWASALLALGVVAVGSAGALALVREGRTALPHAAVSPQPAPLAERPARGAFAIGGVPAPVPGDERIARAFGADVPAYLIALDRRTEARRAGEDVAAAEAEMRDARARALAPEVREALGGDAAEALSALLDAARRAADQGTGAAAATDGGGADDSFVSAVAGLDDALAAAGIGYFADGDVISDVESGRRLVVCYTYRVARVERFAAGDKTVVSLHLRRLDKLNWSHALLGFTRPTLRFAAVLLDKLDEQVIGLIAPGLAPGAAVQLFDPEATAAERAAVEARAGELVRAEYGAAPGLDEDAARRLGKLLGRRRALFAGWEKLAAARGMALVAPPTLRLPEGFAGSLSDLVPREDLLDLMEIDTALDDRTREDAFATLVGALAASVERHEVQHRLDALGPNPPPMPAALEALVGPLEVGGRERRPAATARAELSAYLAELARDPLAPRVGLTQIARFLFDRRLHGSPECYAALVILEGLSEGLGGGTPPPILHDRKVDRRAAADVYLALTALPPERLREGARALWEKLFGVPLVELHELGSPAGEGTR